MKSFLFGSFLFIASALGALEIKEDFIQRLSPKQSALLQDFFLTLSRSSCGYVLYGEKPVDIQSCDLSTLRLLSGMNPKTVVLIKGNELWHDLNLTSENKEFILTSFVKNGICHIVCINRKAFLQTVQENLNLFKYVLGPTTTPEGLLHELLSSKDRFYQVLKENEALTGVLFGHGTQNALLHARHQELTQLSKPNQLDEFPFLSKTTCKSWSIFPKKYNQFPSFGFASIVEEESYLEKMLGDSIALKPLDPIAIPQFECRLNSQETKNLILNYEETRKKILKAITSKTFLPDTLRKFFTSVNQVLEIPNVPKEKALCLPNSKEETTVKVIEIIQKTIGSGSKKFLTAFIQGVTAREKGQKMPVPNQWKRSKDIDQLERDLECCKNLLKAEAYFKRLSEREDLVSLVPNAVYYKTLKPGNERTSTSKLRNLSFQYSMQILGDKESKEWGIVKQENIAALIPGMAMAMKGMAEGEERVIYIHPRYAYGENTSFPTNASIVTQVRLLNFDEGENEAPLFPTYQLEQRDYKDLLTKFEVLRAEGFFDEGVEFWDSIKKSGDYIDFLSFQKLFNVETPHSFQSATQEQQFVSDLEYQLLSLQKGT